MKSSVDKNKKNILHTAILIIVVCLSFICMGTYAYFTQDRTHIGGTITTGEFPQEAILEGEPETASPSNAPMMLMAASKASPSDTGEEGEEADQNAEQAAGFDAATGPGEPALTGEDGIAQSADTADGTTASDEGAADGTHAPDITPDAPAPEENLTDNSADSFADGTAPSAGEENALPPDAEFLIVEPLS